MTARLSNDTATLLSGTPVYKGTIIATTTKNNHDTAVPFLNTSEALTGKVLLIQSDAAAYILPGTANTATVTTANGILLGAYDRVVIAMGQSYGWLAGLSVSGTANIKVWELI